MSIGAPTAAANACCDDAKGDTVAAVVVAVVAVDGVTVALDDAVRCGAVWRGAAGDQTKRHHREKEEKKHASSTHNDTY